MIDLARLRREADFALKHLRGPDDERALAAAVRFAQLPTLASLSPSELRLRAADVRRSHALDLVALEHGFGSWSEVTQAAAGSEPRPSKPRGRSDRLPRPPSPGDLARRVAARVRYFAEPIPAHLGGGHRLDVERVREETLAAILDALRGDEPDHEREARDDRERPSRADLVRHRDHRLARSGPSRSVQTSL